MKVGDYVYHKCYGLGKILYIDYDEILVEYIKPQDYFHSGMGRGKDFHCYWVFSCGVKKVSNDSIRFLLLKEK